MDFNAYQKALPAELRGSECPFGAEEFDHRLLSDRLQYL